MSVLRVFSFIFLTLLLPSQKHICVFLNQLSLICGSSDETSVHDVISEGNNAFFLHMFIFQQDLLQKAKSCFLKDEAQVKITEMHFVAAESKTCISQHMQNLQETISVVSEHRK